MSAPAGLISATVSEQAGNAIQFVIQHALVRVPLNTLAKR